ncbi:unnamed protein product [Mytilus coruscus]|uniref:C-type lectin domain-containing protein n=1 Tax=Mytilus coruscus TaxID=42192 RepID=A0A6J8EDU5_MYTCO|nr:unnamed protein product [Mytilus coruscus]
MSSLDIYIKSLHDQQCIFQIPKNEVMEIKRVIIHIVKDFIPTTIKALNPRFTVLEVINAGSYFEHTKVKNSDEFDFMVVVRELSTPVSVKIQKGCILGYANVRQKGRWHRSWMKYTPEKEFDISILSFNAYLRQAVSLVPVQKCRYGTLTYKDVAERKALTDVQENIGKVLNKLENDNKKTLDMFKETLNTMGQKIKKLDTDFKVLGKDFRKTKWHKYNGHCYYYSSDSTDWFTAERKCREIGGYIVKIDDKEENGNIASNRASSGSHHWIGLTDLKEGVWRWSYDQSKAVFTTWYPSFGAKGTSSNCVMLHASRTDWYDYDCHYSGAKYICESNFCF